LSRESLNPHIHIRIGNIYTKRTSAGSEEIRKLCKK